MILRWAGGWLLFDENYLLLGCNYLSDYSPETFLWKYLGAFERLKGTCSFRFTGRCTEIFIRLFVSAASSTRYCMLLTQTASFAHFLLHPTVCNIYNCLCFSYAYAWGSVFFYVFSFCVYTSATVHCAVVTLWIVPLGTEKLPINPFWCFSRILRCICESGWHQEEWTPAVWYLQQGSECTMKPCLSIMVIAHQGTLSFHYIKQFDRVILSGHF